MKKLISLILCIVLICFTLVGCSEDILEEARDNLDNYKSNEVADDEIEKLNFYIITGKNTTEEAKITVPQNVNAYIKEKYRVTLNIVYCTVEEYDNVVYSAMDKTNEAERPDIVLINSSGMYDKLRSDDRLACLNDFYKSRDFRSINTIIDDALLAASAEVDTNGTSLMYYTVPNNHVIGEYRYIVIDKSMARDTLHFSNSEIKAMTTEASLFELKEAIKAYYNVAGSASGLTEEEFIAQYVQIVSGDYDDMRLLQYGVDDESDITDSSVEKNIVNVNSYPTATKEEAFRSAFAIVKHLDDTDNNSEEHQSILTKHYTKCMSIIFALNNDVQLRNMLQYGYVGTNYKFIKNEKNENTNYITLITGSKVTYEMDPIHTGNLFNAYYCEEIGWNEDVYANYLKQNADAKTVSQKINTELENIQAYIKTILSDSKANPSTVLDLPLYGSTYSDVVISWSDDSEYAVIDSSGVMSFVAPEADTNIKLSVIVTCGDTSSEPVELATIKLSLE